MKYIKAIALFGFCLMLTGCGGKYATMTCEKTEEINGFSIVDKNITQIEKDLLAYYDEERTTTALTTAAKGLLPQYSEYLETSYGSLYGKSGIIYSTSTVENVHTIKFRIEYYNINKDELNELNDTVTPYFKDTDEKIDLDESKKEYEKDGYNCTIKEDPKP